MTLEDSKVIHVAHLVDGRCSRDSANGVDRSIWHFAKYQAALGCKVTVICATCKVVPPIPGVIIKTIKPLKFPLFDWGPLLETFKELTPDILHLHGAYVPINVAAGRVARKLNLPYVFTPHGNYSEKLLHRRLWLKWPYRLFFERPLGNGAAFIHAINDCKDIRKYGVKRPIVEAINGVEIPENTSIRDDRDVYRELGIEDSARVLMFLGRLDIRQKGLDILLSGFGRVIANCPDLYLVLIGPDWQGSRTRLSVLAQEYSLGDRLIMTGGKFGGEKLQFIRGCDFFIHPSRWEAGVPFSVLEALAYGKPALVSNASDPLGHISSAGAGLSCEIEVESIASAFEKIDQFSVDDLAKMGNRAVILAQAEFSWSQSAGKLVEEYRNHLATHD